MTIRTRRHFNRPQSENDLAAALMFPKTAPPLPPNRSKSSDALLSNGTGKLIGDRHQGRIILSGSNKHPTSTSTRSKSIDTLLTNATGVCRTPLSSDETIHSGMARNCRFANGSLDSLLENKRQMKSFKTFLKSEFSEENIEFYIACEKFKRIKGQRKMASKAKKLYQTFIHYDSPKQVNLDAVTRSEIFGLLDNPNTHMFDVAQRRVQNLLENDSYRRFLEAETFRKRTATF